MTESKRAPPLRQVFPRRRPAAFPHVPSFTVCFLLTAGLMSLSDIIISESETHLITLWQDVTRLIIGYRCYGHYDRMAPRGKDLMAQRRPAALICMLLTRMQFWDPTDIAERH